LIKDPFRLRHILGGIFVKKKMVSVGLCMILMLSVLTSCNSASLSDKATAQPSNMMMQGEGSALEQETAE